VQLLFGHWSLVIGMAPHYCPMGIHVGAEHGPRSYSLYHFNSRECLAIPIHAINIEGIIELRALRKKQK